MKTTDRPTLKLLIVLCYGIMTFYVGLKCSRIALKYPEPFETKIRNIGETQQPKVPTFIELQKIVGAKPDGIIGPNTIALWHKAICNQYAAKYMTPSGEPK